MRAPTPSVGHRAIDGRPTPLSVEREVGHGDRTELAEATRDRAGGRSPEIVTDPRHSPGVFSALMLRLIRSAPMSEQDEIIFEAAAPPAMTPELAVALAQLVRGALARQADRPEQVA